MSINASLETARSVETQNGFEFFQKRLVLNDLQLSVELFASHGDMLFICGKENRPKGGFLLVVYEIPIAVLSFACNTRLSKTIRLEKKRVQQMETVSSLKILLLLADGMITIYDVNSLNEIGLISKNVSFFAASHDFLPNPSSTEVTPNVLRLCVVSKEGLMSFFRWLPQRRRSEEEENLRSVFDFTSNPRAIALSRDRICTAYEHSYLIFDVTTGKIINELILTRRQKPMISCFSDSNQWCLKVDNTSILLKSNFDILYDREIVWEDIPSAVIQAPPYILALINHSIHICLFNKTQYIFVQRISIFNSPTNDKCQLWIDAQTKRIYIATLKNVFVLEPKSIHAQVQEYIAMHKYDIALIIIRTALDISESSSSASSSANDSPRTTDGHAKGNLDLSVLPEVMLFSKNSQDSTRSSFTMSASFHTRANSSSITHSFANESTFWLDYYRVGTMYAFQFFHQEQFQQAFGEFQNYLTDPAEIICLFESLSTSRWLPDLHKNFTAFIKQNPQFSHPVDFAGGKLRKAFPELQIYLTEIRVIFLKIHHHSPESWLEVQSLVQNKLILRPVHELLIIVETALLKIYFLDNNKTLIKALLRREDNCCLPSEVEFEFLKHKYSTELISFYHKHHRHNDALQFIANTKSIPYNETILNYFSTLNDEQLSLVCHFIQPMIQSALQEKNEDLLKKILRLFIGESMENSSPLELLTIQFNSMTVYRFLQNIDEDFAIRYLKGILPKLEKVAEQHAKDDDPLSNYVDDYQKLLREFNQWTTPTQLINQTKQFSAPQSTSMNPTSISSINIYRGDLVTQQVDVIVVCSSSQILFDAICAAGGDSMKAAYDAESNKASVDSVISVKADGQLKSKAVYFLQWQVNSDNSVLRKSIQTFVANAITKASSENYQSLAFPAIGCGQFGCSTSLVAQVMTEEAYSLSQKHTISVMFVIQPQRTNVYDEFQKQIKSIQQREAAIRLQKATSISVNKGTIELEMGDIITQTVDVIIVSTFSQFLRDAVIHAAGNQIRTAYNIAYDNNPHSILISTPSGALTSKGIFFVKWQPDKDAVRLRQSLVDLIQIVIQNVIEHRFTSVAFPAIGCGKHGCSVDIVVQTLVKEMKHQLNIRNIPLKVKFVIQSDQKGIYDGFCQQMLAAQEDALPSTNYQVPLIWEQSKNRKLLFELLKTSDEYKTIETSFDRAMKGKCNQIVRIERIQNERWYIQYLAHRYQFHARLNADTERRLYHGCPEPAANLIPQECFNRSFAGDHVGALFGAGAYFSSDAVYSHDYAKVNSKNERRMFIVRVLIGNTTIGNKSMKIAPMGYDSTTNGTNIFVTYHDAQAYAEYLITYK